MKIVGWCFIALAAYIVWASGSTLIHHAAPERSIAGIVMAAAAIVLMPLLARAKRRVASALGSGAMHADSRQTGFFAYLSGFQGMGEVTVICGALIGASFGFLLLT